jgi:hypothetical protein
MAWPRIAKAWGRLTAGITRYDLCVNLIFPVILLVISSVHLFCGFLPRMSLGSIIIIVVDAYLFFLLLLAALKVLYPIPERQIALVSVPALLLVLMMSFADVYIRNEHITRTTTDCKVEALREPWDAAYFSLVTITTLGYGDYTPQDTGARKIVIGELLSGALLLLFAIPVLGSRLAMFDEPTGMKTVLGIRRLDDGSWEVQENNASAVSYPKGKRFTISAVVQGKIEPKSSE